MNSDSLLELKELANENIDKVLSELNIDLDSITTSGNEIRSACPIHEGADNPTAFCYNTTYKFWRCYTKNCHEEQGNIYGLIMKMLSKTQQRKISFDEAVSWLCKVLDYKATDDNFEIDPDKRELEKLIRTTKKRKIVQEESTNKFKPFEYKTIKDNVKISDFFLKQGFKPETLKKYCVGFCDNPNKPMYMRSYAPVLDETGEYVIGVTGRTVHPECQYCGEFHIQGRGCPKDNNKIRGYPKWLHYNFKKSEIFYNLNFAKPYIEKTKVAILVEGPKEVWAFEQNNIKNSLCIFGVSISDWHLRKLIKMGVQKVVFSLDNDEAGIEAQEKINAKLSNYFTTINICNMIGKNKDIADTDSSTIENVVLPYLKSLEVQYA